MMIWDSTRTGPYLLYLLSDHIISIQKDEIDPDPAVLRLNFVKQC